ncbi:MAG: hypothetical protein QNJ43_07560 [Breoghania sp.]|nr:hypothetical protein [Breoghania sp.]
MNELEAFGQCDCTRQVTVPFANSFPMNAGAANAAISVPRNIERLFRPFAIPVTLSFFSRHR